MSSERLKTHFPLQPNILVDHGNNFIPVVNLLVFSQDVEPVNHKLIMTTLYLIILSFLTLVNCGTIDPNQGTFFLTRPSQGG